MSQYLFCAAASLCLCTASLTQAQIASPKVGTVRFAAGDVHAVYGLHSNYIIGRNAMADATAVSFSDRFGLIASNHTIQLLDSTGGAIGEYATLELRPVLSVGERAESALVWLPLQHAILHWNGKAFAAVEVVAELPGTVLSIERQDSSSAVLLTCTPAGQLHRTTVSLTSGNITQITWAGETKGTAFEAGGSLLTRTDTGWQLQKPDGSVRPLAIPAQEIVPEKMSGDSIHLSSPASKGGWVLRLGAHDNVELFELPAVQGGF